MKQLILSLSLAAILLSCKKTDSTPTNPTTNKDTTQTSIAKYGAGVTDIDGNKYKSVIIGTQEWMGENLKVSKYHDGSSIPNVVDNVEWSKLNTAAFCNYNNSDSIGKIYGKLYNWYAVNTSNLCPTGWHVPTEIEWDKLVNYLGGDSVAGVKIKEIGLTHWNTSNIEATNTSLFTALPNGFRSYSGNFSNLGEMTNWWSSTESNSSGWLQYCLMSNHTLNPKYHNFLGKGGEYKVHGISVRCLKN